MRNKEYSYNDIKKYINEGDILLYKGKGLISKLISSYGQTPYSHIGIASWVNGNSNTDDGILECVEFREGSLISGLFGQDSIGGGRSVNLYQEVKKYPGQIDVYRPNPVFYSLKFNYERKEFIFEERPFNGKSVTAIMRKMTGLPYGWKRILWMIKHKLFIYRLCGSIEKLIIDDIGDIVYPVCSTAISYCFNNQGYDLVNNRNDEWTEPGDIAKSTQINYFGTLVL